MAKRIDFIAPVEAMRGNLSGTQTLLYAENDNPAYEAPDGRQYARNYRPSFIGAKRSSDGLKYFSVRTKSAVNNSASSRVTQAALGAAGNMASRLFGLQQWAELAASVQQIYENAKAHGITRAKSVRAFFIEYAAPCFAQKQSEILIPFYESDGSYTTYWGHPNPFVGEGQYDPAQDIWVSNAILVKFWLALARSTNANLPTPAHYWVGGQKGICFVGNFGMGNSFSQIIAGGWNVLGLTTGTVGQTANVVKLGEFYVAGHGATTPITSDLSIQEPYIYDLVPVS